MPRQSFAIILLISCLGAGSALAQTDFQVPFEFCPNQHPIPAISFALHQEGPVQLVIEHIFTKIPVRTLIDGFLPAGQHQVSWDGSDAQGQPLGTGVYVITLSGEGWEVQQWSYIDCGYDSAIQSRVVVGGHDVAMGFANVTAESEPTELGVYTADGSVRVKDFSYAAYPGYAFVYWAFEDTLGQVLPAGDYIYRMASPPYSEDIAFTIDPIERGSLAMTVTGSDGNPVQGIPGTGDAPLVKGPLQQLELDFGRSMSAAEMEYLLGGGLEFYSALGQALPVAPSVRADSTGVVFHDFEMTRLWPDVWGDGSVFSYGMFDPYSSRVKVGFDHEGITRLRSLCQPGGEVDPSDWVFNSGPFYFSPGGSMNPPCNNPIPPGQSAELQFTTDKGGVLMMQIIDTEGNLIRTMIYEYSWDGPKVEYWNRLDDAGVEVPEGIYRLIWTAQGNSVGGVVTSGDIYVSNAVSEVSEIVAGLQVPTLSLNQPNPFNPTTVISFDLPVATFARISVLSLDGKRVATLLAEPMGPGRHSVTWDGRDHLGQAVPSGVYFYRMEAGATVDTGRMLLLK